jgi:ABC-2 type transport system ATP-binding protein
VLRAAKSDASPAMVLAAGVSKTFAERAAVADLTFEIQPGTIFGMVGPSGCGKTTTIRLLTGVYRPTAGSVRVFGHDPNRFSRADREKIGYLPQHFVLYPELSVLENLGFVAGIFGVVRKRRQRVREVLDFVDLWEDRRKPARELSGGMQRRLGLAAALLHEPALLFVDEPTAGIDPVLRARFWDGFRELRERGCTVFLTTQYVTEAEYCDRVAVLREGRLVTIGAPAEIRRAVVGGEAVELEAEGLDDRAIQLLEALPGMRRVTVVSPEIVHFLTEGSEDSEQVIAEALRAVDVTPRRFTRRQPSFDEVFVMLMDQSDREDEAALAGIGARREDWRDERAA